MHTSKCDFIYATQESTACLALMSTKLINDERYCCVDALQIGLQI